MHVFSVDLSDTSGMSFGIPLQNSQTSIENFQFCAERQSLIFVVVVASLHCLFLLQIKTIHLHLFLIEGNSFKPISSALEGLKGWEVTLEEDLHTSAPSLASFLWVRSRGQSQSNRDYPLRPTRGFTAMNHRTTKRFGLGGGLKIIQIQPLSKDFTGTWEELDCNWKNC